MGYYSEVAIVVAPKNITAPEMFAMFAEEHPEEAELIRNIPEVKITEKRFTYYSDWVKWYTRNDLFIESGYDNYTALEEFAIWAEQQENFTEGGVASDGVYVRLGEDWGDISETRWGDNSYELVQLVRMIDIQAETGTPLVVEENEQ